MSQIQEILGSNPNFVPAVVCFPVRGDEVLLMHRSKTSDGLGQDLISGIGGKVGDDNSYMDETHEEALVRELQEEIGIIPTKFRKVGRVKFIWSTKPKWNMDVTVYIVDDWEGVPTQTEVAKPIWYKIKDLPKESMWEDNLYWVPRVLRGEQIDAIFLYGKDKTVVEYEYL